MPCNAPWRSPAPEDLALVRRAPSSSCLRCASCPHCFTCRSHYSLVLEIVPSLPDSINQILSMRQGKRVSIRLTLYEPCSSRCHSEERSYEESAVAFRVHSPRRPPIGQADFTRRRRKVRRTTADPGMTLLDEWSLDARKAGLQMRLPCSMHFTRQTQGFMAQGSSLAWPAFEVF